jgi:hypothetical protein
MKNVIQTKLFAIISIMLLVATSIAAWIFSYTRELSLAYNDSMSHVNIARFVIDNQEPGLAQLGSVWLPVNHVLPLLFVWNDWAWRTGMAATVFSMASYIISCIAIYKTTLLLTKNKIAGVIAGLAFATNLNMLYVQSTPLTEPLYVCFFSLSVYIFARWLLEKNNGKYLLLLGALGFLQVLTRYDGWFVVAMQGGLIALHELFAGKENRKQLIGKLFLYGLPIGFAVGLWILWNAVIFNDPLYFAYGQYSSHAQEKLIEQNSGLLSKGDIVHSMLTYGYTMIHNIGEWVLGFALLGLAAFFLFFKGVISSWKKIVFILLLASPIIFNVVSMYLGFSTIQIPEFYGDPVNDISSQWFNVRFGIVALPFAAILLGMFAGWQRLAPILVVLVIVLQTLLTSKSGVITATDGLQGSSSFQYHGVSNVLRLVARSNETVLMSISFFNPVAHRSNISLQQLIHEGVSNKWDEALENPQDYADLIVMGEGINAHDPIHQKLVGSENLEIYYEKIYSDDKASIYRKKTTDVTVLSFSKPYEKN